MAEHLTSTSVFLAWHDSAGLISVCLLALVAILVVLQFVFSRSRGHAARFLNGGSLRTGLIVAFILIGTLPTLALGVLLAERSAHLRHDNLAHQLERNSVAVAWDINHFLEMYTAGVRTAAAVVSESAQYDADSLSSALLLTHETYGNFLTMLATDRDGQVVAATSNMSGFLSNVPDLYLHDVSDRSYYFEPMANGEVHVSDVFLGRDLGQDPIVAISAPFFDKDRNAVGVLEGSLNLNALRRREQEQPYLMGTSLIVVDRNDRVMFSTDAEDFAPLQIVSQHPWIASSTNVEQEGTYNFAAGVNAESRRYIGTYAATDNGWRVFMRVPLDDALRPMRSDYIVSLLLMGIACLLSLFAAGAIVRRVTRTVDDMNLAIESFTADGDGEKIRTPYTTAREFRPLFRQMRKRAKNLRQARERLTASIAAGEELRKKLTQNIARKEAEIADRTEALEDANKQLLGLSRSDALTGIPNRREYSLIQDRIWRSSIRNKTPVAIIMLDIDYFKIFNDSLGHQQGDECLIKVATALHKCATRPLDLVARYGGEEFVAVLGEATLADGLRVAERMRKAIEGLQIAHPGSSHDVVTVSAGVSSIEPAQGDEADAFLKRADEALYYAKAAGRNCVVHRDAEEYVTYESDSEDTAATNVIAILSGKTGLHRL
jgi:diguanylate cyclase (GGDEF)-like protein